MGQGTRVPFLPFPGLPETGTHLHRPKGCWQSSPCSTCSLPELGWGGETLPLHPQGCSGSAVVAQGWPECRWCRLAQTRTLLCLLWQGSGLTITTVPQHSGSQGLPVWDWPGRSTGAPISWLLFHIFHSESAPSPTASHRSTGAGHCFFWN